MLVRVGEQVEELRTLLVMWMGGSVAGAHGATAVTLTFDLPAGSSRRQTWLAHAPSGESRGAFFVDVKRLE